MGAEGVKWVTNNSSPTLTRYHGAAGSNTLYSPASQAVATTYFNSLSPWGLMGRMSLRPDGSVASRCNVNTTPLQTFGDACYSDTDQTGGEQKMVYVAPFCWACDALTANQVWYWVGQIGDTFRKSDNSGDYTFSSADMHPMFIRNSVTKNAVYLSAFEGYVESSTTPYKMQSVAGVQPSTEYNTDLAPITTHGSLPAFRTWATNVGSGWGQHSFQTQRGITLLMLIEYASFNFFSVLSSGINAQNVGTNNASANTGHTTSLGNASGQVQFNMEQQGSSAYAMSYRGIENFYGNVCKWLEGVQIKGNYGVWIADNGFSTSTDNTFAAPYVNTSLSILSSGYPMALSTGTYGWAFIPLTTGGGSTTYLCWSGYTTATGNCVGYTTGQWSSGAGAGPIALNFDYNTGSYDKRRGARLEYIPP